MSKVVFVTGASKGIGKAIVKVYKSNGYRVIAPSRSEMDLASSDSVKRYLQNIESLDVDILINNAGENIISPIEKITLEHWHRTLTVNLTSSFLLIQAFAPIMAKKKWGRIVNVSSCYSFRSREHRAPYSASKAGLNGLTRTAALEYGKYNILVNAVCPGFVDTELTRQNNNSKEIAALAAKTALNRLADTNEIAQYVVFLGSEKNTYITGQTTVIDGGFSCQ